MALIEEGPAGPGPDGGAGQRLAELGGEYFRTHFAARPFAATAFGVAGYDAEVPDPGRAADERLRGRLAGLAEALDGVDRDRLTGEDRVTHSVLASKLRSEQDMLRWGLHEVAVSASMMGPLAALVSTVPSASVADPPAAEAYLARLGKLGGYIGALARRQREAAADGRFPTERGVQQAIAQLDGYLDTPLDRDPLLRPAPGPEVDAGAWRARVEELVTSVVRPALVRYRTVLTDVLQPVGRLDGQVGVCHVPGGVEGYLAHVRAHTTTDLSPEEIHATGLRLVAGLREEFAERGGRVLGTTDVAQVLRKLRDDRSLRFARSEEIVAAAEGALRRAEQALPDWFRGYDIAPCVVRAMDPVEAENSVLGYYRPPAGNGSRPGTHVVNTHRPGDRPRFEYEALAFHESVPGHHLQISLAQSLTDLPDFRRFSYVTAHGEGWALYTERLCDEIGLYSGELERFGMVSFDAWRACRLVVDTGMHHYGWSRGRAVDYMRDNTALSETNIANEVDRYIAAPGQALAYMVGRLRINELRDRAREALGAAYDPREFHHQVLGHGPVPLDTLEEIVTGGLR
jgi:uncharacterized protein (DUF885 family)